MEFVPGIQSAKCTMFDSPVLNGLAPLDVRTAHRVLISLSAGFVDLRVKMRYKPLGDNLKMRPSRSPVVTSAVRLAVDVSMIQAFPPAKKASFPGTGNGAN